MSVEVRIFIFDDLHDTVEITDSGRVIARLYVPNEDVPRHATLYDRLQWTITQAAKSLEPGLRLPIDHTPRIAANVEA